MKKPIASLLVAAATLFGTTFTNTASAAEWRTYPVSNNCYNLRTSLYNTEYTQQRGVRDRLNTGTVICDVQRANPMSNRGARAIIRFDSTRTNGPDIEGSEFICSFAAVNVWGREIFIATKTMPMIDGFQSIVLSLPRTVVNGSFKISCQLPEAENFWWFSNQEYPIHASAKFPSFTIIEL